MSIATKDGAWISERKISRFDCDKCGTFFTSRWPCNDREADEIIRKHAQEKHKGIWRALG